MTPYALTTVFTLFLLLVIASTQNDTKTAAYQTILLNQAYPTELKSGQSITWELAIKDIPKNQDLFFTVQSPMNDPLQQPFLTIKTSDTQIQQCDSANNEFAGICIVDNDQLTPNHSIYVTAKCLAACHLSIIAAFQPHLLLDINKQLTVTAPTVSASEYQFQLQVPMDVNFTYLAVFAEIIDFVNVEGGLQFCANYGTRQIPFPRVSLSGVDSRSIFWGGKVLYFQKQFFTNTRNWIKIYLSLSAGMQVRLYTKLTKGNDFTIKLGEAYFDYKTDNHPKNYYLDLNNEEEKIGNKSIVLGFIVYSGEPKVRVAFDANFNTELKGVQTYGSIVFLIDKNIRKYLSNGTLFISVTSLDNYADYYFYTALQQNNYLIASPDTSYYNKLEGDSTFNYFFSTVLTFNQSEESPPTKRTYSIKADIINGQGYFKVRRCQRVEKGENVELCLVNSIENLSKSQKQQFLAIPVTTKKGDNFYQMIFEYDVSKCSKLYSEIQNQTTYYCFFQVIAYSQNKTELAYTWTLTERGYSSMMKEGQVIRESVLEKETLYYSFALTSFDFVNEVTFFITVIEGDVRMISSTQDPYPSLDSKGLFKISGSNRIVYKDNELKKKYYISVEGKQFSEYTIGVIVSRASSEKSTQLQAVDKKSKLNLQMGVTQNYILKQNYTEAIFVINVFTPTKIKIEITELIGTVQMSVKKGKQQNTSCQSKYQKSTIVNCVLEASERQSIQVTVTGEKTALQNFIIVYYKESSCTPYTLNYPTYQQIVFGQESCLSFSITKIVDIQVSMTLPLVDLIQNQLLFEVCINNGPCIKEIPSRHFVVMKEMLSPLCEFSMVKRRTSCNIELRFINNGSSILHFDLVAREQGMEVALLDGIVQRVTSPILSVIKGKYLYYEVTSTKAVRILFTVLTDTQFLVLIRFAEQDLFNKQREQAYLDYSEKDDNSSNIFTFSQKGSGSKLFVISSAQVKKCKDCVLIFSVFATKNSISHPYMAFDLEVSQQETILNLGESKKDYIEQENILIYQLQQPTTGKAVLNVRDINKQSSIQNNCFQLSLDGVSNYTELETLVIEQSQDNLNLYILGIDPICEFEITYTSVVAPLVNVIRDRHYSFELKQGQTIYFYYHHNLKSSFRVTQILQNGEAKISINSFYRETLSSLLKKNISAFAIKGDEGESNVLVTNKNNPFFQYSNYLIALESPKGATGQLIISRANDRIPLSVKGVLKQKIIVKEKRFRNYTFSSISEFNISLTIIYGKINIAVRDSADNIVTRQNIYTHSNIKIKPLGSDDNSTTYESSSKQNLYFITVEADQNSQYIIKVSKINVSQRLFEGVHSYLVMNPNKFYCFQFSNMQLKSSMKDVPPSLNVIIKILNVFQIFQRAPKIGFTALASKNNEDPENIDAISRLDSDSGINVELPLQLGDYYINITSDQHLYVSIMLVKQTLIHLKPFSSMLMNKPGIFELYATNSSVMVEIYACEGNPFVTETKNYSNFLMKYPSSNQVDLLSNNYGGHFVISNNKLQGEQFFKVGSKGTENKSLAYLIDYSYFGKKEVLPYQLINLQSNAIQFSLSENSIIFRLKPVITKNFDETPVKGIKIEYKFYFASKKEDIISYSNCKYSKYGPVESRNGALVGDEVQLAIQTNSSNNSEDSYYVGAEAVVHLVLEARALKSYPQRMNMIYNVIQMNNKTASEGKYSITDLILWTIIPFILAAVVLVLALRFCIRRYKGMVPDDLVEEQPAQAGPTESGEVVNQEKKIQSEKGAGTSEAMQHDTV